jgi:hypothetical protein
VTKNGHTLWLRVKSLRTIRSGSNSPLKKWLLEAVEEVPEVRDARQAKLVPAQAGIQFNNEAYFLYVE